MTAGVRTDELARMVREKRGKRALRTVAQEVGIAHTTLQKVEAGGRPDVDTFFALCRWLQVDADLFAPDAPEPEPPAKGLPHADDMYLSGFNHLV